MAQRSQAIWRVLAFLYGITVASLVTTVVAIVGILWMIIDIPWQLLSGRNDLSETSRPAMIVEETLLWNIQMLIFALTGGGPKKLEWTPMSES